MIDGLKNDLITSVAGKQDKLIAGSGITIANDGKTISSSGKEYTAGNGIQISSDGVISTKAPSEITVYSPIIIGSLDVSSYISTSSQTTNSQMTVVSFGTGKRTTNSYSIPFSNSLKKFSTENKTLSTSKYFYIYPNDFPSFLKPVDGSAVNLSFIILDSAFATIGSFSKTITKTDQFVVNLPSGTMLRNANLSAYLTNASW